MSTVSPAVVAPQYQSINCDRISSSNFPKFDRNPNTGVDPATATETKVARQTVFVSHDKASHTMLPLIPRQQNRRTTIDVRFWLEADSPAMS